MSNSSNSLVRGNNINARSKSNSISNVPQALRNLGVRNMNLERLDLSEINLTSLPKEIGKLKNLQRLTLFQTNVTSLPKEIGNLKNLKVLFLDRNNLTSLPKEIGNLKNLKVLFLSHNNLTSLPKEIGNLKNLKELDLSHNNLTSLPKEIGNLKKLQTLFLGFNNLISLPKEIGNLKNLQVLVLSTNPNLKIIPRTLRRITGLEVIKDNSTLFESIVLKPVQRKNVPLNKVPLNINNQRTDALIFTNFRVGHNAVYIGHNKYLHEKTLLNLIIKKKPNTNITNINTLYSLNLNENVVINPFTIQPLLRKNLTFVKIVKPNKPNTPNTLAKNLNKTKINNKPKTPNTPKTVRKKAGNAAQSRRTNVNNNNR